MRADMISDVTHSHQAQQAEIWAYAYGLHAEKLRQIAGDYRATSAEHTKTAKKYRGYLQHSWGLPEEALAIPALEWAHKNRKEEKEARLLNHAARNLNREAGKVQREANKRQRQAIRHKIVATFQLFGAEVLAVLRRGQEASQRPTLSEMWFAKREAGHQLD